MQVVRTPASRVPVFGWFARKIRRRAFKSIQNPTHWIAQVEAEDATVVQIGSNDGKKCDPLNRVLQTRPGWRALFVEPVPYLFERLKQNYAGNDRHQFACTAINHGETATFYHVDPIANEQLAELPDYYELLGSFDRDHILKHADGVLEPFIVETEIEGTSLSDLLTRHDIEDPTVLHIDTEGHDWEVLKQLDLTRHEPRLILLEHAHLSEEEKDSVVRFLQDRYDLYCLGPDFLALRSGCEEFESARWKLGDYTVELCS